MPPPESQPASAPSCDSSEERACLRCGACCAHFRVSFYWADAQTRGTPEALVERLTPLLSCMAGTNQSAPRCAALKGTVGECVTCSAYDRRPTPCRELQPGDTKCNQARVKHGLAPLHRNTNDT